MPNPTRDDRIVRLAQYIREVNNEYEVASAITYVLETIVNTKVETIEEAPFMGEDIILGIIT